MRSAMLMSLVIALAGFLAPAKAEDAKETQALLGELGKAKVSLRDGVRQAAHDGAAPISAKFELEDGKLSLSVYTAEKGLKVDPEKNILQELSGSPEQDRWTPNAEVFKDVEHVARSSEQLTLMALGKASLVDIIERTQKAQPGTVFSVRPVIRNHRPAAEVLVAEKGVVKKIYQPL